MQDKAKPKPAAAAAGKQAAAPDGPRQLFAEFLGTLILVATVVGSGIMGAKLSGGNTAIALLGNTIPTGAILVVLISVLGPVSGAHFNPVVTMVMRLRGEIASGAVAGYIVAQIAGGSLGAILANAMFDLPALQIATTVRGGSGQWIAEVVATFGLLGTILGAVRYKPDAVPMLVGLYITAAYWFTSSTSFANPASRRRRRSPTLRSASRACSRTHSLEYRRRAFRSSSPCRSSARCWDTRCSAGCSSAGEPAALIAGPQPAPGAPNRETVRTTEKGPGTCPGPFVPSPVVGEIRPSSTCRTRSGAGSSRSACSLPCAARCRRRSCRRS